VYPIADYGGSAAMTTLMMPSLERRLLQTVREEVTAEPVREWPPRSLQLCLNLLRDLRASATEMRQALENELAAGVEARSFARTYGPVLPAADGHLASLRELIGELSPAEDTAAASFVAELRLLEREHAAYRDLLAAALSRAAEAPRPVDWERVRAAEEAKARGETKPYSRR
jgi:hypothetical protein